MATAKPTARTGHVYVIPCSGKKLDHAAPARELYRGSYFLTCWRAAAAFAGDDDLVLILSARHGFVTLDQVLEPYDAKYGNRSAVSDRVLAAQARLLGIEHAREVTVLAGAAYVRAVRTVWPHAQAPLTGLNIGKQLQLLNDLRGAAEMEELQRKYGRAPAVEQTPEPAAHPVDEVAEHGPLYELPYDYKQTARDFTVTVAGPERHDGEKPYTYLVKEYSTALAWAKVLAWFMVEQETPDAHVVASESFEGVPEPGCGYFWTDLRPEFARQEALDDLADQAAECVTEFQSMTYGMTRDGAVLPDRQAEYDQVRDAAAVAAWPLVQRMAENDGR
ncbi:DUF6884 domain-containing protein [Streptomyces boncukensis]|uniref:DUF6884 domain-containing protein n=1 Tax=Streptomyces boncukensis TaxID=2711219 RepID=A0A6G4WRG7_9ACTN|nr:DUF6884 domain-containing protein [Streptomyces boncukensis]NGO67869.1 hypothetical protein [Streptomyces boncukensis]